MPRHFHFVAFIRGRLGAKIDRYIDLNDRAKKCVCFAVRTHDMDNNAYQNLLASEVILDLLMNKFGALILTNFQCLTLYLVCVHVYHYIE
jgi:hypothetical protein